MAVPFVPSASNNRLLETWKEYILAWKEANPGRLCKIGGKQESQLRHHNADQYNPLYFDTSKAIVFAGTFTESRLAAWLELMLIKFAFSLGIGGNKNRNSPNNMACLPGENYSETNLGCIYLVPVHTYITTQDDFFEVHVSSHNKKKELIDAGDFKKGKHQNPGLRKPSKQQDLSVRKQQDKASRKKPDQPGWARKGPIKTSDAELQNEVQERLTKLGGAGIVSPQKAEGLCGNTTRFFTRYFARSARRWGPRW
jgi:hypothetical protein